MCPPLLIYRCEGGGWGGGAFIITAPLFHVLASVNSISWCCSSDSNDYVQVKERGSSFSCDTCNFSSFCCLSVCLSVVASTVSERSATRLRRCSDTVWYVCNSCLVLLLSQCVECSCWCIRLGSTRLASTPLLYQRHHMHQPLSVAHPLVSASQAAGHTRCQLICSHVYVKYSYMFCCLKSLLLFCWSRDVCPSVAAEISLHWSQKPVIGLCSRTWQFITMVTKACHWAVLGHGISLHWSQKPVIGLCSRTWQFITLVTKACHWAVF